MMTNPTHKELRRLLNFLNYNFIESIRFHFTKLSPAVSVFLMWRLNNPICICISRVPMDTHTYK